MQNVDDELPRPCDGFALVVIAEAEVAEHLEECPVPPRPADALDVALRSGDAQTALDRDDARRGRRLLAEKDRNELLHPGDREERRRHLVRNQARRRKQLVLLADEEVDPRLTQLLAFHGS